MRNSYGSHVLAAVQFVGAGRTAFLAFDGTFRWRARNAALFDRFWVQLIRYLAEGKLLGGAKRGILMTDREQFSLGEAVAVTARLFDARYEPLKRDRVTARYEVASGNRRYQRTNFVLTARPDRPGTFEGQFVPDRIGSYRIVLHLPDVGGPSSSRSETSTPRTRSGEAGTMIVKEIRVSRPNLEILRPQADRMAAATLAEQSDGGRYFDIDEAADLPEVIEDLHQETRIRSRPTSLWDNGTVLLLLVGLLSVEWAVRKWRYLL